MIGSLNEKSLHATLKHGYAQPGDQIEVPINGYMIDLVRPGDPMPTLIEIQTRNFAAIKPKLLKLLPIYPVRLVHPIAIQRDLILLAGDGGEIIARRKSPKRGRLEEIFRELVFIPDLIQHPNLTIEVLLLHDAEIRRDDGQGSWRRKHQSIADRRLIAILGSRIFNGVADFCALLPAALPETFTTADLAKMAKVSPSIAGKMVYCLRQCGGITLIGKAGRSYQYRRSE